MTPVVELDDLTPEQLKQLSPKRLRDNELVDIFPEMVEIIPEKLKELGKQREALVAVIKDELATINVKWPSEEARWFWREVLKIRTGQELLNLDRDIARLRRQLGIAKGLLTPKGALTDDLIQAAREVPVEEILNQEFRRSGRDLVGLCPFHEERTGSFHIYTQQNRGWCFSCNWGGDAISIAMRFHDCSFRDAVKLLTGER